jgi:signal transduction histidine kinase
LILIIVISLSIYEDGLNREYASNLELVSKSINQIGQKQLKSEFLAKCDTLGKQDCIECALTKNISSLVIRYYKTKEEIPQKDISNVITLNDGSFIALSVSSSYIKMQIDKIRNILLYVFLVISAIFTIIIVFLNKKLFYSLKCLVNLCNDITEQSDSVTYCSCTYEIKDLRDAITNLLCKNQSLYEKKSDMFKEIAHELKSPIAIMQARLSLLSVDNSSSNVNKYINDTDEDIEAIKDIIYELLFLEEIEMDIQNTHKSNISMKKECEIMQSKFEPILKLHDITVSASWDEDFTIHSFKHSMQKVMQAIYENVFIHAKKDSNINVVINAKTKTIIITNESKSTQDHYFKSTNIGTKIIQRLSKKLDFTFETNSKDNIYTTTIVFHS